MPATNERASKRLNAKELAILPHFFRVMATKTNGKWLIPIDETLYELVCEELNKAGSKIQLKFIDAGIRRVIQNLQTVGILRKDVRGRAIMTRKGVEIASHYR